MIGMSIVIIVTTSKKEFVILGGVEIRRGGRNILHSKEINYLMPKCLMMERHFAWLRHLVYPCKYECVRDCMYECGMNESDCVC